VTDGYRAADTTVDQEIDAFKDLQRTIRTQRARVAPFFVIAVVAATIGAAAHVNGVWSVFGRDVDGNYLIFNLSIVVAMLGPAAIGLVPGVVLYWTLRARGRALWRERHRALSKEQLGTIERRVR